MEIKQMSGLRYLVKVNQKKDVKTDSGIITDMAIENTSYMTGKIINVGDGIYDGSNYVYCRYSVGENIMFESRNLIEVTINGEEMNIVPQDSILALI